MADPSSWSPKFDEQKIRDLIGQYAQHPKMFDGRDDDIEVLEDHAHHYRIPFTRSKEHQDGFIGTVLKNASRGWMEGFTTLPPEKVDDFLGTNLGDAPEDTTEAIARNLGHLAGFVGYLPGGRILKALGAVKLAGAVGGLSRYSVPMRVASLAQKKVGKAVTPYLKDLPNWATTGVFNDMAQGAFHLGAASAVSSWTHGVDEMFHAAGFGAGAGAVFRGIGNMKGFGTRMEPHQLKPNGSPNLKKMSEGQIGDLAARTMAGAAFQGLPSTLQNATTEEQVYAYAMGAFFGYKEMPYQTRTSRQYLHDSIKGDHGPDPELNPRWDTLTKDMQGIVKNDFREFFGPEDSMYVVYDLLKGKKIDFDDIENLGREYREGMEVDESTGEVFNKAITKKEVDQYKEDFKNDPRFDDPQDLDMHIQDLLEIPGRLIGKGGYVDNVFRVDSKGNEVSSSERIKIADEIYKEWSKKDDTQKKPRQGAEQEIIEFIETKYGKTLAEDDKGWWRRWAENTRKKEWIEQIEMVDGKVGILRGKTNAIGNKKDLSQERPLIQEIYGGEHEKYYETSPPPEEPFIRVLDHMIWGGKEYDLVRAGMNLARQELVKLKGKEEFAEYTSKEKRKVAENIAKSKIAEATRELHHAMWKGVDGKAGGYYYYGGKGDSKKMYFVKMHPAVSANPKISRQLRRTLTKVMRNQRDLDGNKIKGNRKSYNEGLERWLKNLYPSGQFKTEEGKVKYVAENPPEIQEQRKRYEQMYVSNALYDLSNNGYSLEKQLGTKESFQEFETKLSKVLKEGYINDPKAFNKRAQIWFNSGLSANPSFIFPYLKDKGVDDFMGSTFRVGIFKDANEKGWKGYVNQKKINLESKATEYGEISDGAIIAREHIVDALNADKGLPTEGKMNKSFIVSPNKDLGALLGKYAIHVASPELESYMVEQKIHMMIPKSAAKQLGERVTGELSRNSNNEIEYKGELYDIEANHFRTVMSEITSNKYLKKQSLPKQMLSVLSAHGFKDIDPKVAKDMYDSLSNRAVEGTPEGNKVLDEYMGNPTKQTIKNVVENIEDMPVNRLMDLIRNPDHPELSQKLYEKILKLNTQYVQELAEEGEISRQEIESYRAGITDFESIIERLARVFPSGSIGAYMHKFSRDYRMTAMRNYVVQKITKPKVDNSVAARMRPYDIGMQNDPILKILNTKEGQDMFFLDNNFAGLVLKDSLFENGRTTLGELWTEYQLGEKGLYRNNLEKVGEVLHGLAMRVPMDSISGAHSLKFGGFTGVKGLGALLHPRTMKALGGADLDGDKSFIFFGGEDSGFKKSWREMYHGAKDEFVETTKEGIKKEKHNKEALDPETGKPYAETLANRDKALQDKFFHQMAQYSPYWRDFMSKGASSGRDLLGAAVLNRMAIIGSYNTLRGHKEGKWSVEDIILKEKDGFTDVLDKNGKMRTGQVQMNKDQYSVPYMDKGKEKRVVFRTKNSKEALQRFRELARASIALGSDPMDEAGLKGHLFETEVLDTLFRYEIYDVRKGVPRFNKKDTISINKDKKGYWNKVKKKGLHSQFLSLNSKLYGRNHNIGRRWGYSEIKGEIERFNYMPEEARNTFLPQIAETMKTINWSDNLFRRINHSMLNQIYYDHSNLIKDYDWLKDIMGRDTIATTQGKFVQAIFNKGLHREGGIAKLAGDEQAWERFVDAKYIDKKTGDEKFVMGIIPRAYQPRHTGDYSYRKSFLEHLVLKGEDFIVNDLSDMASLKSITDVIKKHGISAEVISEIHSKVDEIKLQSIWAAKTRKALDDVLSKDYADSESNKIQKESRKAFGLDDKASSKTDQVNIDAQIRAFKSDKKLNTGEKDLFDMLYMGTYSKGDRARLASVMKMRKNKQMWEQVEYLEKILKNTSLTRAGLNSKEISDVNLKIFFENYDNLLKEARVELSDKERDFVLKNAEKKEPITSFRDDEGNLIKGEFIDSGDISETDRLYLDTIAPFEGITSGKVKDPEMKSLYYRLKEHLDHYHNLDVKNLNGFFRGLFKKDINQATKYDLKTLDRYFKDMRDGTWFRQAMDWMVGKEKAPQIKRAYYWMFPKAVNRDLMRHPAMMDWVDDVGPYKDRRGNTIESARVSRPTAVMGDIQQISNATQEQAMQASETQLESFRDELRPFLSALEDGDTLFQIAIAKRELGYMRTILRPKYKDNGHKLSRYEMDYQRNWDKVKDSYASMKDKIYVVPTKEGRIQYTGEAIINMIDNVMTKQNVKTRRWMTGDEVKIKEWLDLSEKDGFVTWEGLDKLRVDFHKYIMKSIMTNKNIPLDELGIDGVRKIVKRIIISQTPKSMRTKSRLNDARKKLLVTTFDETGDLGAQWYFPHMAFDRRKADMQLRSAMEHISKDPNMTPEEKKADIKKLSHEYKQLTGDFISKDDMGENFDVMQEAIQEAASGRKKKAENILTNDLKKVGNQYSRDSHIGGWDVSPEAYESYMKNTVNTFYKQAMQIAVRTSMHNFREKFYAKTGDNELAGRWMNYFKLYAQSAMGYPTHIPKRIMDDPLMNIKGTAYKWLADSTAKKRIDYIRKRLGVGRKELEKWNLDEATVDELSGIEYTQLQSWGAMEAKWQLASLLAHPKSSIANLYGGTVHTWISAGYENLKNARSFEYLKTHINPKWESMKDVERWMQELGVIEEFLIYEAGLNPDIKSKRTRAFTEEAIKKIRKDPNASDESLWGIAKKHNMTKAMFNKAASFMRVPERILRRDAFMAHYLQAKNKFGGAIKDFNSPFLINMAKRGVKGTQFLYSAPYRPMWTNSTLGRVMSRFQLWSWNSVRFRNDVVKRAHIAGYQEGTTEFETFKRLAIADAFMIGMSNLFMYSLFENALPAPWNWMQDTADLLFGTEKERERAFYGSPIGPLQAVTPPALRLLPPLFKGMMSDDYSQLTDYYLWTIPPFGRLIRDVVGPGGAIENPYYAITKFTGLPVLQLAGKIKEEKTPRIGGRFLYG